MRDKRSYPLLLAGFAVVLLCIGTAIAISEFLSFRPGGEFDSPTEKAVIGLFIWCIYVLGFSGLGFAFGAVPSLRSRGLPLLMVVIGGVAALAIGEFCGFGFVSSLSRNFNIPQSLLLIAAGLIAGVAAGLVARVVDNTARTA